MTRVIFDSELFRDQVRYAVSGFRPARSAFFNAVSPPARNSFWQRNKALAGYDRTHNFQTYAVYEIPLGRNHEWMNHGVAAAVAGGLVGEHDSQPGE